MKHTTVSLIARIEAYCRRNNMAETTFGAHAVNDGKLVARLRAGKTITLNTVERIENALADSDRENTPDSGTGTNPHGRVHG